MSGANASATLTLSGSEAQINSALATLSYLPGVNYNGSDSLTILSTDTNAASSTSKITITVVAVNDAPSTFLYSTIQDEDTPSILVTFAGADVDGTVNAFRLQSLPANGTLYTDATLSTLAVTGVDYAATGDQHAGGVVAVGALDQAAGVGEDRRRRRADHPAVGRDAEDLAPGARWRRGRDGRITGRQGGEAGECLLHGDGAPPGEPAHGVDGGLESVPDIVEAAGGGQQFLTRRCQARGATGLVEKRHSYGVGELSDLDGDRRLRQVQRFGSTRETAQAGDGGKGLKLAESDAAAGHCISFDLWLFIKYFI